MGNTVDTTKQLSETRQMNGRRVIKTSVKEITADNLMDVLMRAMSEHALNRSEIDYLWNYYRGKQPILHRTKEVRPEICNKIVENRANEIVSFKVGYLCGEPIQYVGRNGDDATTEAITALNELMFAEDKATKDQEVVEWQMICGTAYRLVLPDTRGDEDEAPFEIHTLDPRDTFVVYSNEIGHKPMMGVKYYRDDEDILHVAVYTENRFFRIDGDVIVEEKATALDMIPIFEYPANNARLGAFEIVLPLLDAINGVESNRMDGIEQFIQAYWKFIGCNIDKEKFNQFLEEGAILVPPNDNGGNIDVDLVVKEMNQGQTQTLKEDLYNAVLTICGIPNRNGGSSTSDTGAAVLLRDGWSLAEARAKDSEHMFKKAEKKMLKLVLRICREYDTGVNLFLKDIDLQFTRRNYENIQSKSQVLVAMLQQPKIHPLLAFQHSGLFVDPESAYALSMEHYEEEQKKMAEQVKATEPTNAPDDN
jgi:SPP1 family phage portal protein